MQHRPSPRESDLPFHIHLVQLYYPTTLSLSLSPGQWMLHTPFFHLSTYLCLHLALPILARSFSNIHKPTTEKKKHHVEAG